MKVIFNIFFLIICSLFLSSCGFKALYKQEAVSSSLDAIEIDPINTMEGAELHRYLSDLLPLTREPLYILRISFTSAGSPIAIQKNSDVIRENVSHTVQFELLDIKTSKMLTSGKFKQMTSYNSTFSPYGSNVEREHTAKNLTKYSSEEIRRRLILYFKSHNQ